MSFLTPSGKKFGLHTLMAMSTMVTPTHSTHMRPLVQAGGGDAISEVAPHQLYLSHGIQDHIRQIFEDLCAPRSTLSREQLADFLKNVQEEEINLDQEEYKFEEFIGFVYYHGAAIRPVNAAEKDLTKPISNYYISSSHNTYLSGNQLASKSSTDAYKNVLIRGCRCIEIDVHNGESPDSASDAGSNPSSSPKPEHKRHLSGSTLSSRAGAMVEKAEQKYEKTKALLAEKIGKDKDKDGKEKIPPSPSMSSLSIAEPIERPPSTRSMRLGEPLVLHGWTLTTPVGFRAVCQTIRDTAFETSNLPIIVSLEVHADLEQQEIMVDIMKEEWKGMLVEEAHEACNPDERLPRLEEVLNKILIKVKKAAEKPQPVVGAASLSPNHTREQPDSGASGSEDERASSKKKAKICPSLSALGIYTHSEHFTSFESKAAKKPPHVFSIGERQIMELHEKKQSEMFTHNRDYFMRAYPAGFRFDSSNLDPSVFWRKGVQMVALNWQMWDEGMMLNEGMFAGENGWVLKPRGYRSLDPATNQAEAIEHKTLDLKITIFAGQHVPVPDDQTAKGLHPYIKCELHVEKSEERTGEPIEGGGRAVAGEYKQQTPFKKGDHPDFGPEGFQLEFMSIPKVVEELSFIRFKVEDSRYVNDSLAAWACIRLDRLQQGYRFVSLLDAKGQATPGLLMVKIEKTLR